MTEPIGPQYGLEPRREPGEFIPPIESRSLVSEEDYRTGSEFSGVMGLIQPPPHTPTATERLHMMYALDPMDDGVTHPDSVAAPETDGNFNSEY